MLPHPKECSKCGNQQFAGPLRLEVNMGRVYFDLPERTAGVIGYICTQCGYTEIYVDKKGFKNLTKVLSKQKRESSNT